MTPLSGDVLAALTDWLPASDAGAPPLIQLATVDGGMPDVRSVLLSAWDQEGFLIHTDVHSRKAAQLAANPAAAFVLVEPAVPRQLVVQGTAEPATAAELQDAYLRRTPYLRVLAHLNSTAFAQLPRTERVARWAALSAGADALEAPETWVGFRIRPTRVTFWASDAETASLRTEYRAEADGWSRHLLAG